VNVVETSSCETDLPIDTVLRIAMPSPVLAKSRRISFIGFP